MMGSQVFLGRLLILLGVMLVLVGVGILVAARFGLPRLPGDILIERRGLVVYVPIVSALVLSVVLTVVLNLLLRR